MTTEAPANALTALADHRDKFIKSAGDVLTQTVEQYAPIEELIRSIDEAHQEETAALKAEHTEEIRRLNLVAATAAAAAEEQARRRITNAVTEATAELAEAHQGELRSAAEAHEASLRAVRQEHAAEVAHLRELSEADVVAARTSVTAEMTAAHAADMAAAGEAFDNALADAARARSRDLQDAQAAFEQIAGSVAEAHQRELASAAVSAEQALAEIRELHATEIATASERHAAELASVGESHALEMVTASGAHAREMAASSETHHRATAEAVGVHRKEMASIEEAHAVEIDALKRDHEFKLSGMKTMWLAADASRVAAEASLAEARRAMEEHEASSAPGASASAEIDAILFPAPASVPDLSTELAAAESDLASATAEIESLRQGGEQSANEAQARLAAAELERQRLTGEITALTRDLEAAREALVVQGSAEPTASSLNVARAETRNIVRLVAEANPDIRLTEAADLLGAALQGHTANAFVLPLPVLMGTAA